MTMSHTTFESPAAASQWRALGDAARALAAGLWRSATVRAVRRDGVLMANGGRDGPPDLDELWRDFNRKLSGLFGGKGGSRNNGSGDGGGNGSGGGGPNFQPDMKSAGIGERRLALVRRRGLMWGEIGCDQVG